MTRNKFHEDSPENASKLMERWGEGGTFICGAVNDMIIFNKTTFYNSLELESHECKCGTEKRAFIRTETLVVSN